MSPFPPLQRLGLRYPRLFLLFAALALFDLFVPDVVPFIDEIVLALTAGVLALWKRRRDSEGAEP